MHELIEKGKLALINEIKVHRLEIAIRIVSRCKVWGGGVPGHGGTFSHWVPVALALNLNWVKKGERKNLKRRLRANVSLIVK